MLSKEENERLTRVGTGTLMGDLMRQYWQPILLSSEVEADDSPVRVRALGEDVLAFRDTEGLVGLIDPLCAHRRAPLFYGRNEECGLRCIYHGWKYDVFGHCVDMPNERPETSFKDKVRLRSYPCVERGGMIWTYLGPRSQPPPLPELEWTLLPDDHRYVSKRMQYFNWVQALEGEFDQSHVSFLHKPLAAHRAPLPEDGTISRQNLLQANDKHPRFEAVDSECGVLIGAGRDAGERTTYWRITQFLMPFYSKTGPHGADPVRSCRAWVPMDDENVMLFAVSFHPTRPLSEQELAQFHSGGGPNFVGDNNFLPATSQPGGRWRPKASKENDYFFDRHLQRTKLFSGVPDFWAQDIAVQEGAGRIVDRSQEHVGSSDKAIIQVRQRLLRAAEALHERGTAPPDVDDPSAYRVRGAEVLAPTGAQWIEVSEQERRVIADVNQPGI